MNPIEVIQIGALVIFGAPIALFVLLAGPTLMGRPISERLTSLLLNTTFSISTLACLMVAVTMVTHDLTRVEVSIGTWYESGPYAFHFGLLIDRLSLPFAGLTAVLFGLTTAFSHRYMHRESGYNRFFVLVALFAAGLQLIVLGDSIQLLIIGWECVGLSSVLLIAFFHDRPAPVQNGFRTFVVYHATDIGLLCAAGLIHHAVGDGTYAEFLGTSWPSSASQIPAGKATFILLLILISVAGKSAQFPFSGWLPRAMEGPTPSSAIFYGALSVHTGAFLLLRLSPILDQSPTASSVIILLGLMTALHATLVGRVQTDIKSSLAYATLTQVGLITVEIGFGLRWLPLLHITGHACIRSLQFLRAPSFLSDFRRLGNATGHGEKQRGWHLERLIPDSFQTRLYRYAIERGNLDGWLNALVVHPFKRAFGFVENIDHAWCDWIGGKPESNHHGATVDRGGQDV